MAADIIIEILRSDKDMYIRQIAGEATIRIASKTHVPDMRDAIDDNLYHIAYLESLGYPFDGKDEEKKWDMRFRCMTLEHCINALYGIDPRHARDAIVQVHSTHSIHAIHFAKRAKSMCEWKI